MRILIIEDNDTVRARISELVESYTRLEVIHRSAPPEGTELDVNALCPDVILLGFSARQAEAMERLISMRRTAPDARIIVLSEDPDSNLKARCLSAGADAYLDKALDFERIIDVLCLTPKSGDSGGISSAYTPI